MVALEHWLEEEETAKPVEKEVELLWEVIEEEGNHLVDTSMCPFYFGSSMVGCSIVA